jgi:hypothetical protein
MSTHKFLPQIKISKNQQLQNLTKYFIHTTHHLILLKKNLNIFLTKNTKQNRGLSSQQMPHHKTQQKHQQHKKSNPQSSKS